MLRCDVLAFYASLHRLAKERVPGCTEEQVRKVANRFHDRDNTRLQCAFLLYWELREDYEDNSYADTFLEILEEAVREAKEKQERKRKKAVSVRDFWIKAGG